MSERREGEDAGEQNDPVASVEESSETATSEGELSEDPAVSDAETVAKPEAEAEVKETGGDDPAPAETKAEDPKPDEKEGGKPSRWWLLLVAVILVEFWVYGRRAEVEVCVGKAEVHDFALVGQERTDQNRWSFPRCESRENLGLRSHHDEVVEDATKVACRGATLFRQQGEGGACVEGSDGWTRQVETSFIWPWDARYYNHLLWFLG